VRLQSIQVLRGIAAMMIFIFHLVVTLDRYSPADLRRWVSHLPLGVDLFFLISGFVMAHSVRRLSGRQDALNFMARRIWRIVPLLYVVTAACIGLMLLRGQAVEMARVVNSLAIFPVLPTIDRYPFALIPAWTLAYEMGFYLIVAVAVAFRWNRLGLVALVLPFALALPLMAEFAIGVAVYELWTRRPEVLAWDPAGPIGKAGLYLGTISYSLYLTHVVTFDAFAPLCLVLPLPLAALVLAALGLAVAALVYRAVEAPLLARSAETRPPVAHILPN
jgi:peptidoglycan/LPS O-acetylase OafA/YrhL